MVDSLPAAAQAQLLAVRERFAAQLGDRLAEIGRLAEAELNAATLPVLQQRLHSLAGACGMFGFAELGQAARRLEVEVGTRLLQGGADADPAELRTRLLEFARMPLGGEGAAMPAPELAAPPATAARVAGQPIRVGLVEPDAALRRGLVEALEPFGYQIEAVPRWADLDGAALDIHVVALPQLVPQQSEALPPCIYLCERGDFEARLQAARAGGKAFLTKPVDVPRLAECIEELLRESSEPPPRVLVIDDEPLLTQHFRLVLEAAGMRVETLNRVQLVLETLAEFRPEVILLDLNMPEVQGQELARVIRQQPEWVGIAITYLSAETSLDKQIAALDEDGDDFLVKPLPDRQLVAAVAARARRARALARLAAKDSLTGLLKHAAIREQLVREMARKARQPTRPLSVAMVDIDHFKRVNDTWGHAVGDRVIKVLAQLLRQRLRNTDSIGRYGGEEFLVVMPDCSQAHAHELLEDIRRRFAGIDYPLPEGKFSCSLSAGVATAEQACDPAGLIDAADKALYQAKHAGRNRICDAIGEAGAG